MKVLLAKNRSWIPANIVGDSRVIDSRCAVVCGVISETDRLDGNRLQRRPFLPRWSVLGICRQDERQPLNIVVGRARASGRTVVLSHDLGPG